MDILRLGDESAYTLVWLSGGKLIARKTYSSGEVVQREFPARYDEEVGDKELGKLYRIYEKIYNRYVTLEFDVSALRNINRWNAFFARNTLYFWHRGGVSENSLDRNDPRLRLVDKLDIEEGLEKIHIHDVLGVDQGESEITAVWVPWNQKVEKILELMAEDELKGRENINPILKQRNLDGVYNASLAASLSS